MDDLSKLDDGEFENLKRAVNAEQQRRDTLARSADQIRELVGSYVDAGGSIDDLVLERPEPAEAADPVVGDSPEASTSPDADEAATIHP